MSVQGVFFTPTAILRASAKNQTNDFNGLNQQL